MTFVESSVLTVTAMLHGGERGFAAVGERLHDQSLKEYFAEESVQCAAFAYDLEGALGVFLSSLGEHADPILRQRNSHWSELNTALGSNTCLLIDISERAQVALIQAYTEAMCCQDLTGPMRDMLISQRTRLVHGKDKLAVLRKSTPVRHLPLKGPHRDEAL